MQLLPKKKTCVQIARITCMDNVNVIIHLKKEDALNVIGIILFLSALRH